MNKKGQGMSLNVIIIAALALIVLVVLIAIFTGRISVFSGQVASAEIQAKAAAANIGKTTCQDTCFAHSKWDTANTKFLEELVGVNGAVKTACTQDEERMKGTFTDVKAGQVCCVTLKPTAIGCSY